MTAQRGGIWTDMLLSSLKAPGRGVLMPSPYNFMLVVAFNSANLLVPNESEVTFMLCLQAQ